jgi:hypothetical protein
MSRSRNVTIGLVVLAVLGPLDVVGVAGAGLEDAPPLGVLLVGALLGVVTLVGVKMAWTAAPHGITLAVVSRIGSALLGLPVFVVNDTPAWAKALVAACILATVLGLALVSTARRRVPLGT